MTALAFLAGLAWGIGATLAAVALQRRRRRRKQALLFMARRVLQKLPPVEVDASPVQLPYRDTLGYVLDKGPW